MADDPRTRTTGGPGPSRPSLEPADRWAARRFLQTRSCSASHRTPAARHPAQVLPRPDTGPGRAARGKLVAHLRTGSFSRASRDFDPAHELFHIIRRRGGVASSQEIRRSAEGPVPSRPGVARTPGPQQGSPRGHQPAARRPLHPHRGGVLRREKIFGFTRLRPRHPVSSYPAIPKTTTRRSMCLSPPWSASSRVREERRPAGRFAPNAPGVTRRRRFAVAVLLIAGARWRPHRHHEAAAPVTSARAGRARRRPRSEVLYSRPPIARRASPGRRSLAASAPR
jgi:hypothetical protein